MSQVPFNVEEEIDKLVERFGDELKNRLKKLVARSEKQVLKAHMLSQAQQSVKKPQQTARFDTGSYTDRDRERDRERDRNDKRVSTNRGGSTSSRSYRRSNYSDDESDDERR